MAQRKTARTAELETLKLEVRNGIGLIWLNRPELRNAFNRVMIDELQTAFEQMQADPAVHAVAIAGLGPAFCAGADLTHMKRVASFTPAQNIADATAWAEMLYTLHSLNKPTVARVHGATFAGGLGLIAACDIAVAAFEAEFCVSEVKLGLVPATMSPYVLAAIGERAARRYFLTGERFGASEAYRIGLVQDLVPDAELDATVNAILGHLVTGSRRAQQGTKEMIAAFAGKPITAATVTESARRNAAGRTSSDAKEGVRAFLEKRKPAWLAAPAPSKSTRKRR